MLQHLQLNKVEEATKVTATVPEDAQEKTKDANGIILSLANGKTVTVAYTLVNRTVASCTPAAITAGDKTIIKGTDLDLVASITFPGDVEQTVEKFAAQNANAIAVTVPCSMRRYRLQAEPEEWYNHRGEEGCIEHQGSYRSNYRFYHSWRSYSRFNHHHHWQELQNIQNLYISFYKVNRYTSRTNTEIVCQVPANAEVDTYKIVMEDPDGNKIEGPEFKVVPAEKDIAELVTNMDNGKITYPFDFSWSSGSGKFYLTKEVFEKVKVKVGSKLIVYKDPTVKGQVQSIRMKMVGQI